jgi:hypothetical protein
LVNLLELINPPLPPLPPPPPIANEPSKLGVALLLEDEVAKIPPALVVGGLVGESAVAGLLPKEIRAPGRGVRVRVKIEVSVRARTSASMWQPCT